MSKRILLSLVGAAGLMAAAAAPATAGTAWSFSIAGPGYAVAAGRPVYYGAPYVAPYRHHWHRAYVAPVVVSAPVVYEAPVVVRPAVVYPAPRVVYAAPVVVRRW